jgi:hypothetical protein
MTDADLNFLARQNERIVTEIGSLRDDMRVFSAIVMRLDNTRERQEGLMTDMLQEMRAIHGQIARMNDRVRKLEDSAG